MFKLFVFVAILAFAFAAPEPKPKPGLVTAAYTAPIVAPAPIAYSSPLLSSYVAAPVVSAYSTYNTYPSPYYAPYAYSAPLVVA